MRAILEDGSSFDPAPDWLKNWEAEMEDKRLQYEAGKREVMGYLEKYGWKDDVECADSPPMDVFAIEWDKWLALGGKEIE